MKLAVAGLALLTGCALFTSQTAKTVLDVAQVLCVVANAESDDATIQRICGIADVLIPDVRKIVAEQRAASRRFAAEKNAACEGRKP